MNYRLAVSLASAGLLMGIAATLGLFERWSGWLRWFNGPASELYAWLVVGVVWVVVVSDRVDTPFTHLLLVALVASVLFGAMPVLFYGAFVKNNPVSAAEFAKDGAVPPAIARVVALPMSVLFFGVGYGSILGLVASVIRWLRRLR